MECQIVDALRSALNTRIDGGEMFTAWDITRELRKATDYPHWALRQVVHALFFDEFPGEGYTRTLCELDGSITPAWVYHRLGDNPEHYLTERRLEKLLR
jgi:hypothetical protein